MKQEIEFENSKMTMARNILMDMLFPFLITKVFDKNLPLLIHLNKIQLLNEIIKPSWQWCHACFSIATLIVDSGVKLYIVLYILSIEWHHKGFMITHLLRNATSDNLILVICKYLEIKPMFIFLKCFTRSLIVRLRSVYF